MFEPRFAWHHIKEDKIELKNSKNLEISSKIETDNQLRLTFLKSQLLIKNFTENYINSKITCSFKNHIETFNTDDFIPPKGKNNLYLRIKLFP